MGGLLREDGEGEYIHNSQPAHVKLSKINISKVEISSLPYYYYIQTAHNYSVNLKKPPETLLCTVTWLYFLEKRMTERETETDT